MGYSIFKNLHRLCAKGLMIEEVIRKFPLKMLLKRPIDVVLGSSLKSV